VVDSVKLMLEKKDINHLLFWGKAGTGKTTLAKLLVKNIPCDYLYINASSENSIDLVRERLKSFSAGAGFHPLKIVILDEADYLSHNAQAGLRNMLEAYSAHTRFILTCNYAEKMSDPLVSRCQAYEIKPISKKDVAVKLATILQTEKVEFTQEDIVFIINTYYPDIRKVINFAQQSNIDGKLKICKTNAIETDFMNKLVSLLSEPTKPGVFNEIRQLVADIDPNSMDEIYQELFNKVNVYAKSGKEGLVIIELAESLYQSKSVIPKVRDITFLACIYKMLKHLR
jgi:replication factor C small subunit